MDWKNLGKRTAVAVIAAPLIVLAAWHGGIAFMALVELMIVLGMLEFYALAAQKAVQPNRVLGVAAALLLGLQIYFRGSGGAWLMIMIFVVLLVLVELFRNKGSALLNAGVTVLGLVYVAGLWSFLLLIRELPRLYPEKIAYSSAGTWLVMLLITVWVCDTAAYFVGLGLGRHKLFERVSPKKTWEGAAGGVIFAILMAVTAHYWFVRELRLTDSIVIGLLIGTVGQASDLAESLFKRDAGVKDSSSLIPGHGGVLDRFDSEMLVAPLVYLYLLLILPH
ncbi:MAG: phosphatidate cytidylyltransferase [candidate division KSB1 bacterium]|nr:phosphatidate cytidylyltransferase [candidate division KSB1 bacterium]MDZ7303411.1 phosphatidate cytidylyltransferase [candidate division KSB1 bacterium]MDZ7312493.1 phosphatidate cytidylyltransferase [candidate division KSB1 bacterium]